VCLGVGEYRARGVAEEGRVPDAQEAEEDGQVALEWGIFEVRVHRVRAVEESPHGGEAVLQREGQGPMKGGDWFTLY
jgi:hypothetical protein